MRTVTIGARQVGRVGLGLMSIGGSYGAADDDVVSIATINGAIDAGATFLDTAEIYGMFANESLVGRAIASRRDEVYLASKFGLLSHRGDELERRIDGHPRNLRIALEGSLRRLGTDRLDLYYLHRVDTAIPIEEVAGTFAELIQEGKLVGYGLSEASAETLSRAHSEHPVTAIQSEYSVWERTQEREVIPAARERGIMFVAYSPLGRGFLTGTVAPTEQLDDGDLRRRHPRFSEQNRERNERIVGEVRSVAREVGATPAQTALAWLLAKGDDIIPIPSSKRLARIRENIESDAVELGEHQLARLDDIPHAIGDRNPDMASLDK